MADERAGLRAGTARHSTVASARTPQHQQPASLVNCIDPWHTTPPSHGPHRRHTSHSHSRPRTPRPAPLVAKFYTTAASNHGHSLGHHTAPLPTAHITASSVFTISLPSRHHCHSTVGDTAFITAGDSTCTPHPPSPNHCHSTHCRQSHNLHSAHSSYTAPHLSYKSLPQETSFQYCHNRPRPRPTPPKKSSRHCHSGSFAT